MEPAQTPGLFGKLWPYLLTAVLSIVSTHLGDRMINRRRLRFTWSTDMTGSVKGLLVANSGRNPLTLTEYGYTKWDGSKIKSRVFSVYADAQLNPSATHWNAVSEIADPKDVYYFFMYDSISKRPHIWYPNGRIRSLMKRWSPRWPTP